MDHGLNHDLSSTASLGSRFVSVSSCQYLPHGIRFVLNEKNLLLRSLPSQAHLEPLQSTLPLDSLRCIYSMNDEGASSMMQLDADEDIVKGQNMRCALECEKGEGMKCARANRASERS